jgi:FXSXX-COOH protein
MDSFSAGMESDIESELIDLGAVSMTALRELDDTVFRQALRHVMQQTAHPQVIAGSTGDGTGRID